MRTKLFSLLLIISLILGTIGFTSVHSHAETEGLYDYSVDAQGNATLTKYNGEEQTVAIPDSIGGHKVTGIGISCFSGNTSISSVTIPNGVKTVGQMAFVGCTKLNEAKLPTTLQGIDSYAFSDCTNLSIIDIPSGPTYIGYAAFGNCIGLQSVEIPEGVQSIDSNAFYGCTALDNITLPTSVTYMGSVVFEGTAWLAAQADGMVYLNHVAYQWKGQMSSNSLELNPDTKVIAGRAFSDQSSLTGIDVPEGIVSIGPYAFYNCMNATTLVLPSSLTTLGKSAFRNCDELTDASLNKGLAEIPGNTFEGCSLLKTVNFPDALTSIGPDAFSRCRSLTSLSFPQNLADIGQEAFYGCTNVSSITFPDSLKNVGYGAFLGTTWDNNQPDGLLYINKIAYHYNGTMSDNTDFILRPDTEEIVRQAFDDCDGLRSLTIPGTVQNLGVDIFSNCSNLSTVYIEEGVTTIPQLVFAGIPKPISVLLPKSVKDIETGNFSSTMSNKIVAFENSYAYQYAVKWNAPYALQVEVAFDSNGGSDVPTLLGRSDRPIAEPTDPQKPGYIFAGWYKDAALVNLWDFQVGKPKHSMTLYAKWGAPIVAATSNSYNSIKVSWAAAGSATSYKIYRTTNASGTYSLVHTSASTARSWIDTGRVTGKTYYYKIYPVAGGTTYKFSTYKSAKAVPATPSVNLTKASSTSIKVTWTGVTGATKYLVYRAGKSSSSNTYGDYTLVHTASSADRSWINTGRTIGSTYKYKVRAYHLEGTTKVYGSFSAATYLKF